MTCNCNDNYGCGGACDPGSSNTAIKQAVNDALAAEKVTLEGYVTEASNSATEAGDSAADAASSASAAAQSQANAETAANTATQAATSVTNTAVVLEETAERIEQAQDLIEEQISALQTKPVYFEVSTPTSSLVLPETESVFNVRSIYVASSRQAVGYGFTFDKETLTVTLAEGITADQIAETEEGYILVEVICDIYSSDDPTTFPIILASNNGANQIGTESGSTVQTELDNSVKGYKTFEAGATLYSIRDFIYDGEKFCYWSGTFPKTVAAGTTPAETGDLALGGWLTVGIGSAVDLIWSRNKITTAITGVGGMLDSQWVSIWEFAGLITNKPSSNPQTWDWAPAFQGAIDYVKSYVQQVAVNSAMWGVKTIFVPAGIYLVYSELTCTKYESSTNSLASGYRIVGDGMTSSIIQPMEDGITVLTATTCKLNLQDIGFRAGANYNQGVVLGSSTEWKPVVHSHWNRVGFTKFARAMVGKLVFDSTFVDVFVQEITAMQDTADYSAGIDFPSYTGPANNSTDPATGDVSNNIVFIRPTIETAKADNTIMFNINGRSNSFAHHAFNIFGGHIETHNRNAKTMSIQNATNINANGLILSQNGTEDVLPARVLYINNATNVCIANSRIITNNEVTAYSADHVKMIAIAGSSNNIRFPGTYIRNPYYSLNAYNAGIEYCVDYSGATRGFRSFDDAGVIINLYTNKAAQNRLRLTSLTSLAIAWEVRTDTNGAVIWAFSSSRDDSVAPLDRMGLTSAGALQTTGNLQIGAMSSSGATRGIDWINNGDKATILAYLRSDTVGRLYFSSYGSAQNWVMGSSTFNPTTDNAASLGAASTRMSAVYSVMYRFTATVGHYYGTGSPEGTLTAGVGSLYSRTDGAAGTSLYVKETGTGNTGWVAK